MKMVKTSLAIICFCFVGLFSAYASEKPKWSSQTIYMMMTQCYQNYITKK